MKKSHSKKEETPIVEQPTENLQEDQVSKQNKMFFIWPIIISFIVGFFLYVQTVNYEYALDDKLVITHNYITKKGFAGIGEHFQTDFLIGFFGKEKNLLAGGRYRPLSLVVYSIENQIFGKKMVNANGEPILDKDGDYNYEYNPFVGHLTNALMYAFSALLLFLVLYRMFPPDKSKPWYFSFPLIATLLWTTSPLHTEVVANIKGRDEIMSLLFALASLFYGLKYLEKKEIKELILSAIMFFAALMSKETAVNFVAVLPLTIYFFKNEKFKTIFIATLPLIIVTVLYVIIRLQVLGGARTNPVPELMNNPFMHAKGAEKFATIFFTLGIYIKLLIFPHPLTHDYYPWHPLGKYIANTNEPYPYLNWGDIGASGSLILYIALIVIGIRGLKTKSIWAYGILFYLGNLFLVSNLVFPVGTFLNERFMYVPSIGFAIITAYFILVWLPKKVKSPMMPTALLMILLVGYSLKTISRNTSWRNDFTLSVGDVEVSYNSAKSNMSAGLALVDESKKFKTADTLKQKEMLNKAIKHLDLSLKIYPTYIQPMLIMGNAYYELQQYENAIYYFEECLKLNNTYEYAVKNLEHVGDLCIAKQQFKTAAYSFETLIKYDKSNALRIYTKLGQLYGKDLRDINNSRKYLELAYELAPENAEVLQKLGVVYAMSGLPEKAITVFEAALEKNPANAHIIMNIGIAYQNMGNQTKAQEYLTRAFEMDPSLRK
jgi:protein O-mannosyl-transferase